jgi:hypothetical protein
MKKPAINSCIIWAKKLADTRLDDLSPSEQAALQDHLEKCPACAAIRLEYQLMDTRLQNYLADERPFQYAPRRLIPDFEFHRLRLLLLRQAERNHGFSLIVVGVVFLLLALAYLIPEFRHDHNWLILTFVNIAGVVVPLYFFWNGIASILSGQRPVSLEEVKQQRQHARTVWYLQVYGESLPDRVLKKNIRALLLESGLLLSGSLALLLYMLSSMPDASWPRVLLFTGVGLMEGLLILDMLYFTRRQRHDRLTQSKQELSRLLLRSEEMTGDKP